MKRRQENVNMKSVKRTSRLESKEIHLMLPDHFGESCCGPSWLALASLAASSLVFIGLGVGCSEDGVILPSLNLRGRGGGESIINTEKKHERCNFSFLYYVSVSIVLMVM